MDDLLGALGPFNNPQFAPPPAPRTVPHPAVPSRPAPKAVPRRNGDPYDDPADTHEPAFHDAAPLASLHPKERPKDP